mgnify:CR=1 FL=1
MYVEHVCAYVNLMHETISLVTLHLHRLPNASLLWSKTCIKLDNYVLEFRGEGDGWAEWAIAHPGFGRIEGVTRKRRITALLLAHPVLGSQLRP